MLESSASASSPSKAPPTLHSDTLRFGPFQANGHYEEAAKKSFKSANVAGAKGPAHETCLYAILAGMGDPRFFGRTYNLIAQIGFGVDGGPPPVGKVKVVITDDGHATATLLDTGNVQLPAPGSTDPAEPQSIEAMIQMIRTEFPRIGEIRAGNKEWSKGELHKVYLALRRIPPGDRAALTNVDLVRVAAIDSSGGETDTAAQYSSQIGAKKSTYRISVADLAFRADETGFAHDRATGAFATESMRSVLHEVGHAVDDMPNRMTAEAAHEHLPRVEMLEARTKETAKQFHETFAVYETHQKKYAAIFEESKKATEAFNAFISTFTMPAAAATAVDAAMAALNAFVKAPTSELYEKAAQSLSTLDKGVKGMDTFIDHYTNALRMKRAVAAARAEVEHAEKHVKALRAQHDEAIATAEQAIDRQNKLVATQKAVSAAPPSSRLPGLVKASGTSPNLTTYSQREWPQKPQELYAEAYSLWLTDPAFLAESNPALFEWFKSGEYRKHG